MRILLSCATSLAVGACRLDMHDQPRYEPYEPSGFWNDGTSVRPPLPGTIARGELADDVLFASGKRDGVLLPEPPLEVDAALLARGRERYGIYCSPCHDDAGNGQGIIVARGFSAPPSFHIARRRSVTSLTSSRTASARCIRTPRAWRRGTAGRSPPSCARCSSVSTRRSSG